MTETLLTTLWPDTLQCRVSLSAQEIDDFHLDLLIVQAWSSTELAVDSIFHIEVQDMTEGISHLHAVYEHQGSGDSLPDLHSCLPKISGLWLKSFHPNRFIELV